MKRLFLTLTILLLFGYKSFAQKFYGLNNSNFGGTQGMMYNPAKAATTRNSFALEFFSLNLYANNNAYKLQKFKIGEEVKLVSSNPSGNINAVAPMVETRLPSFLVHAGNKLAFGFSSRLRLMNQVYNANANAFGIYTNLYGGSNTSINDPIGFNLNTNNINDVGITGSYKILDNDIFTLSAGGSIRKYSSTGFFNLNNRGIVGNYVSTTPANVVVNNIDLALNATAGDLNNIQNEINDFGSAFKRIFGSGAAGKGTGFDLGAEIIIRNPKKENEIENKKGINFTDDYQPYKLKFGLSLLDVGAINYKNVKNATIKGSGILRMDSLKKYENDIDGLRAYAASAGFTTTNNTIASLSNSLPTTLNIYGEYAISRKFFVAAHVLQNLVDKNSTSPFMFGQLTLVPRYESKILEFAVPVTYSSLSKDTKLGTALRLGPIMLGSDDLGALFSDAKGANLYAGLRLAFNKKAKTKTKKQDSKTKE